MALRKPRFKYNPSFDRFSLIINVEAMDHVIQLGRLEAGTWLYDTLIIRDLCYKVMMLFREQVARERGCAALKLP